MAAGAAGTAGAAFGGVALERGAEHQHGARGVDRAALAAAAAAARTAGRAAAAVPGLGSSRGVAGVTARSAGVRVAHDAGPAGAAVAAATAVAARAAGTAGAARTAGRGVVLERAADDGEARFGSHVDSAARAVERVGGLAARGTVAAVERRLSRRTVAATCAVVVRGRLRAGGAVGAGRAGRAARALGSRGALGSRDRAVLQREIDERQLAGGDVEQLCLRLTVEHDGLARCADRHRLAHRDDLREEDLPAAGELHDAAGCDGLLEGGERALSDLRGPDLARGGRV